MFAAQNRGRTANIRHLLKITSASAISAKSSRINMNETIGNAKSSATCKKWAKPLVGLYLLTRGFITAYYNNKVRAICLNCFIWQ